MNLTERNLAVTLRELREGKGLRAEDLAYLSRVSVTAIIRWEQGKSSPAMDSLLKVIDALGYDVTLTPKTAPLD